MFKSITDVKMAVIVFLIAIYLINFFSNRLGDALHILGIKLKMPDSVRGATLDAVASSFPEFSAAMVAVLIVGGSAFDDIGIPTIAGSGIFNIIVIPALSLIFFKGKKIIANRKGVLRDAFFYIISLLILVFLGLGKTYSVYTGILLVSLYMFYVFYLLNQSKNNKCCVIELSEENDMTYKSIFIWTVLGIVTIWIGIDAIVQSIIVISETLNIQTFIVSVIILASATSIPDTILSVKSAKRGDIDGAISNAVGSNIFNICMCLGLPMIIFYMKEGRSLPSNLSQNIGMIVFLFISMIVTTILLTKKKGTFRKDAYIMLSVYASFIFYIVGIVINIW